MPYFIIYQISNYFHILILLRAYWALYSYLYKVVLAVA